MLKVINRDCRSCACSVASQAVKVPTMLGIGLPQEVSLAYPKLALLKANNGLASSLWVKERV
jgi:hypothetical protein